RDMEEPKIAIAAYEEALRRDLKDFVRAEVKEELAECLVKQADYEHALALLGDCGPRAEREPLLLALRGDCLIGLQRSDEARSLLDTPLAETCQKLGKPDLAERWLRSAAACPPAKR